ncbi:MAG: hypothetical protein ACKOXB_05000 [Flavobacteriales bacterium]
MVTIPIKTEQIIEKGQEYILNKDSYPDIIYEGALKKLKEMLEEERILSFKKAVFIVENAWYDNKMSYHDYNNQLLNLATLCKAWSKVNTIGYNLEDSAQMLASASIFKVLTDTTYDLSGQIVTLPYRYDFEDNFARKYWGNMFVTKLLATRKGNCHSLPFLYKILSEELGVNAYLSFLPNHIYIKQKSKKTGWYNTELTNAMFPVDAWIMSSGYVSREAIVSGIYMDTISGKQSVAICINDLAKGYLRKMGTEANLNFVLECCEVGLKYFPNYTELLLLKAETLKKSYEQQPLLPVYKEMESTYAFLYQLHYREIPDQMYNQWIKAMERDENIYNQEIKTIFNERTK